MFLFTQRVRVTVRLVAESHSGTRAHPGKFHIVHDFLGLSFDVQFIRSERTSISRERLLGGY